jgi:hypothetical protein
MMHDLLIDPTDKVGLDKIIELDFYLGLLRGKYKYLTSADAIEESLIANEVEFEFELKERN